MQVSNKEKRKSFGTYLLFSVLLLLMLPSLSSCGQPSAVQISQEYSIQGLLEVSPQGAQVDLNAPANIEINYVTTGMECDLPTDEKPLSETLGVAQPTFGNPNFTLSGTRKYWSFPKKAAVCGQTTEYEIIVTCPSGTKPADAISEGGNLMPYAHNANSSIWVIFNPPQNFAFKVVCKLGSQ